MLRRLVFALLLVAGCGTPSTSGSNSNWVVSCSDGSTCAEGYLCINDACQVATTDQGDAAVDEFSSSSDAGQTDAATQPDACTELVTSPGGPVFRECAHEVPNGSTLDFDDAGNAVVIVDGGVVAVYPPCPCK